MTRLNAFVVDKYGSIIQIHIDIYFQKFKVKAWPKEEYGQFYNGDSYIILNVSLHIFFICICINALVYHLVVVYQICSNNGSVARNKSTLGVTYLTLTFFK